MPRGTSENVKRLRDAWAAYVDALNARYRELAYGDGPRAGSMNEHQAIMAQIKMEREGSDNA